MTQQPMKYLFAIPSTAALLCCSMLGCNAVGPNYTPPTAPLAAEWDEAGDKGLTGAGEVAPEWWKRFNDPTLDKLVNMAYDQNLDLKIAGLRVLEARAARGIAVGDFFPQTQELAGGFNRINTSDDVANPAPRSEFDDWGVGANVAWEMDVWGRFRPWS